ncbi:2'-5' RNA ligase [Streptomyces sp. BpilaLS-43]|nr:2'-5' RNA ligase [Streptomyces sp. BpilaLS-43]
MSSGGGSSPPRGSVGGRDPGRERTAATPVGHGRPPPPPGHGQRRGAYSRRAAHLRVAARRRWCTKFFVNDQIRSATVRVFVALAPPDDAKEELAQALRPAYAAHPRMRWNRIEDWHITLAFLGELPRSAVSPLRPPLAELAARHSPLHLALRGGGHFDERVLWSGIGGDVEGLRLLAGEVRELARAHGVDVPGPSAEPPPDAGPFAPRRRSQRGPGGRGALLVHRPYLADRASASGRQQLRSRSRADPLPRRRGLAVRRHGMSRRGDGGGRGRGQPNRRRTSWR